MEKIRIFCDGGSRGNPGKAASAFIVEKNGKIIKKESNFIGVATNNVAEYQAVVFALQWLAAANIQSSVSSIDFVLDSELVVKQLNGLYKVKNEVLRNLFLTCKALEKKIGTRINYINVPREKNRLADFLVNERLDQKP